MRRLAKRTCTVLLGAVLFASAVVSGQELKGRPLAEFTVVAPDGREVASAALSSQEQWLLIYLSPQSSPSHRLLRLMGEWQIPQLSARTVLIVRGDAATAQEYLARRAPQALQGSLTWYADAQNAAWDAMRLQGTPMLMGVRKGEVVWVLAGVLSRPESLESVVRTWVEGK